jgi:hypothetical protein
VFGAWQQHERKGKAKKAKKNDFAVEGSRFGKSQQKLSSPQLLVFLRSCASDPSDPFIFLWPWATVALILASGLELGWEKWGGKSRR